MILTLIMVGLTWLSLACLLFIRGREGELKGHGLFLFYFFGIGAAACLYLILAGYGRV